MGLSMGKLDAAARRAIPQPQYALPGKRFPVEDAKHAANAKARATQGVKAGTLTPAQAAIVRARANKKLEGTKAQ